MTVPGTITVAAPAKLIAVPRALSRRQVALAAIEEFKVETEGAAIPGEGTTPCTEYRLRSADYGIICLALEAPESMSCQTATISHYNPRSA